MEKNKKKVRNKGRDMLGDYYKTNRQYEKENDIAYKKEQEEAREKGERKKLNSTELTFVIIIALGAIGLFVKYVIL